MVSLAAGECGPAERGEGLLGDVEALSFTLTYNSLGLAPNKPVVRGPRAVGQGTSQTRSLAGLVCVTGPFKGREVTRMA